MLTLPIGTLSDHPAQMRTTYDLDALAALTLQIHSRGLDAWQPIVVASNGDGHHIISGHRRHRARLLAFALAEWAAAHPETEITLDVARTMLATLVEKLGSLAAVVDSLAVKYGDREVEVALFKGDEKTQILALHAANYGGEEPDTLGVAHSFRQALSAGATVEELARNVGQTAAYVRNHLALTEIPQTLAARIAAGDLPLSVAGAVAALPEPRRGGLAAFILANLPPEPGQGGGTLTARAIRRCATTLAAWPGLQPPLVVKHQAQRNMARALIRLWTQVLEAYPSDAYAAAALLIYREAYEEPWAAREKLALWFQVLGGDTYFVNGQIHWAAVVKHLLTEVSCQSCPIASLPQPPLREDLAQGQAGPLGLPCRVVGADLEEIERCLHGLAPADPFDVRVPWSWAEHPGVVYEGEYRVKSAADLQAAWQAQQAREQEAEAAAAAPAAPEAPAAAAPPAATTDGAPAAASPTPPAAPETESGPSPIARQRARIAAFMALTKAEENDAYAVNHPFATRCGACRHRLAQSPTKDETVPHCAWAGRLRSVRFTQLVQVAENNGGARPVPVCGQFAPRATWVEVIPAHPEPPGVPRAWLLGQIRRLAADAARHGGTRPFTFLTGRPLTTSESGGDWFTEQLEAQGGELSVAQLFTLFLWAHSEWERARGREFTLPTGAHGVQFAAYREQTLALESPDDK